MFIHFKGGGAYTLSAKDAARHPVRSTQCTGIPVPRTIINLKFT